MTCIKTGCHACIEPYNEWVYGDAFEFNGVLLIRVCERSFKPISGRRHFTVSNVAHWFDDRHTSGDRNSTMVVEPGDWVNNGYDGEVIE